MFRNFLTNSLINVIILPYTTIVLQLIIRDLKMTKRFCGDLKINKLFWCNSNRISASCMLAKHFFPNVVDLFILIFISSISSHRYRVLYILLNLK